MQRTSRPVIPPHFTAPKGSLKRILTYPRAVTGAPGIAYYIGSASRSERYSTHAAPLPRTVRQLSLEQSARLLGFFLALECLYIIYYHPMFPMSTPFLPEKRGFYGHRILAPALCFSSPCRKARTHSYFGAQRWLSREKRPVLRNTAPW